MREAQSMLGLLQEEQKPVSSSAVAAFMKLVPSRFQSATQALLTEMEASQNIQRMKASDARNKGEDALDPLKFRRTPASKSAHMTMKVEPLTAAIKTARSATQDSSQAQGRVDGASRLPSDPSNPGGMIANAKASVAAPKLAPTLQPKPTNPYAKKAKSLSSYIGQAKSQGTTNTFPQQAKKPPACSDRAAPAYARTSELSKTGKPTSAKQQSSSSKRDPVATMLHQVQAQPFVKTTSGDIVRGIKSNVPSNVCCVICSKTTLKPMLGDCGHMACQGCWLEWLKRSETCPVCRVSVKAKSLARVVFQDQNSTGDNSRGSVTLSQLCD